MSIEFPLDHVATSHADDVFYCINQQRADLFNNAGGRIPLSATDPSQASLRAQWCRLYSDILAHNRDGSRPFPDCGQGHHHHPADCRWCLDPPAPVTDGAVPDQPLDDPVDPVQPCPEECERILRENIIVVGAERLYNAFWTKMMFIAPTVAMGDRGMGFTSCDVKTVLYMDLGYTRTEKLAIEALRNQGFNVIGIGSAAEVISHLSERPQQTVDDCLEKTLINRVFFFCHGVPGELSLDYPRVGSRIRLTSGDFSRLTAEMFAPGARIVSYACRTGVAATGEEFASDDDARPQHSLAQQLATQLNIGVEAFYTRTLYEHLLVATDQTTRDALADALKSARRGHGGQIIDLPPNHEALPHDGLGGARAWWEGTDDYALWRKGGATGLPTSASSPSGLSAGIQHFSP